MMEFVSWNHEIPNMEKSMKIHYNPLNHYNVPNHQPVKDNEKWNWFSQFSQRISGVKHTFHV